LMLGESGFSSSYESSYNESRDLQMQVDSGERKEESVYVEAIK
jgi:hypothetical protein